MEFVLFDQIPFSRLSYFIIFDSLFQENLNVDILVGAERLNGGLYRGTLYATFNLQCLKRF